ncbi:hypothetical protein ATANTOWER_009288 [Ataeniobius toweri]|uniref:Uncharacterized protein n=1 Tax=Ataeniobius toweri TaxID=208326 RepID=A0ABU7CHL8_9TELE|nr:hypothetical protein [Ataeniobius toweri]
MYAEGKHLPDLSDPFPEVQLDPEFAEERSPLLCRKDSKRILCKCSLDTPLQHHPVTLRDSTNSRLKEQMFHQRL